MPTVTCLTTTISMNVPPEVLAQIFFHCIPFEQYPIPSHNQAPLLLTRISSYWRTLAINTPDLWSAFHINYNDPAEDIPATNLWLARSTNRPLSLSLAIDFGEQSQQGIIDAFCRHSYRWKHLRFDFRHLICPPMYSLDIAEGSIPELTTFEFHARDIDNTNLSQIIRLLRTAPNLRHVTWVDDLADTDMLLQLPLNQLTRLSLAMDHGILDYVQILDRCTNLQHIRITRSLLSSYQTYQTKSPPLFLYKLTSLNISYDLTTVLDQLVLPALKHVKIFTVNDGMIDRYKRKSYPTLLHSSHYSHLQSTSELWNPSPLISLIDRSTCDISTLSLSAPMMEDDLLLCLLKTSASLLSLELEGVEVRDKVLTYLTRRRRRRGSSGVDDGGQQVGVEPEPRQDDEGDDLENEEDDGIHEDFLCPKLEDLILHTQIISSQGILADMIASRLSDEDSETAVSSSSPSNPEEHTTGNPKRAMLRKLVIMDGHWDLDRVEEFSSWGYGFKVHIIRRKPAPKGKIRNFLFKNKLCASR